MTRAFLFFAVAAILGLSGCDSSTSIEQPAGKTQAGGDGHDHGEDGHHNEHGDSDMEKMKAELSKMSPGDAASAEKQHFCPVSGKMLGTMGAPQKVDVSGRQVWICCEGCKDTLLADPDEFLVKLKHE